MAKFHHNNRNRNRKNRPQQQGGLRPPNERISKYVDKPRVDAPPSPNEKAYYLNSSPELSVEYFPALFSYYPELAERIPWISLRGASIPSVPSRLLNSQHLFGENYSFIKKESLDFHTLPDNKARKLEFVIGDALARKRKKLVTFGYVGSSHCLATVKAASQLSLKSEVVLLKCPLTIDAIESVGMMKALGAKVRLRNTLRGVMWVGAWKWLCSKIFRTELVAPGGSTGFGVLGYISAMLELKCHIDEGEVPEPDYLFVAAGSGSTIVGMEIGVRWLGLKTKVIGIQTSDDRGVEIPRLVEMGNAAIDILNKALNKPIPFKVDGSEFTILNNYLYGGHGQLPARLESWMAHFLELENVDLDPVYTAKGLFGMSDYLLKNRIQGKSVLFWNTCSPNRKGDLKSNFSFEKLPFRLKRWVRGDQSRGRLAELGRI